MSGKDPDAVSEDMWDAHRAEGYYPDEISLSMVYPTAEKSKGE